MMNLHGRFESAFGEGSGDVLKVVPDLILAHGIVRIVVTLPSCQERGPSKLKVWLDNIDICVESMKEPSDTTKSPHY